MPSRVGSWVIAAGALVMFVGLCCLPSAFGANADLDMRSAGLCLFSLGALVVSVGIYLNARMLAPATESGNAKKESASPSRRVRGGCELCGSEAPVVQCKVHQLQLCGTCLANHYDPRSCSFVPSQAGKAIAARARG